MPDIGTMDYEQLYELTDAIEEILEMERLYGLFDLTDKGLGQVFAECYDRLCRWDEGDAEALNREYEKGAL